MFNLLQIFYHQFTQKGIHIWTPRLPKGVLSNRPFPSVHPSVSPSIRKSVCPLVCLQIYQRPSISFSNFGPWIYRMGSMVITLVSLSVGPPVSPSLNISETSHQCFLKLCMKLTVNDITPPVARFFREKYRQFICI